MSDLVNIFLDARDKAMRQREYESGMRDRNLLREMSMMPKERLYDQIPRIAFLDPNVAGFLGSMQQAEQQQAQMQAQAEAQQQQAAQIQGLYHAASSGDPNAIAKLQSFGAVGQKVLESIYQRNDALAKQRQFEQTFNAGRQDAEADLQFRRDKLRADNYNEAQNRAIQLEKINAGGGLSPYEGARSESTEKSILNMATMLGTRSDLESWMNKNPNAFGSLQAFGDKIMNTLARYDLFDLSPEHQERQQFATKVQEYINQVRTAVTGAAASEKELEMLASMAPNLWMSKEEAMSKIKAIRDTAKAIFARTVIAYGNARGKKFNPNAYTPIMQFEDLNAGNAHLPDYRPNWQVKSAEGNDKVQNGYLLPPKDVIMKMPKEEVSRLLDSIQEQTGMSRNDTVNFVNKHMR